MNVMAQAHKATKAEIIRLARDYRPGIVLPYRELFAHFLKKAHKEYKAMTKVNTVKVTDIKVTCIADKSATDFVIEGTAVDSEGQQVHIGFSTGNEGAAQKEAEYYLNSDNGFKKVDMYLVMHYVNKGQKEFKIVK